MTAKEFDGWITVFQTGTDYEADLVRDRLDDSGIPAVIMRKKDRSFSLTQGSMSAIYVLVPKKSEGAAQSLLSSAQISDADLTEIALAADPEQAAPPSEEREEE